MFRHISFTRLAWPLFTCLVAVAFPHLAFAAKVSGVSSSGNGNIFHDLGLSTGAGNINIGQVAASAVGPIGFMAFAFNGFHALEQAKRASFQWSEMIHAGIGQAFAGVLLGGSATAWGLFHGTGAGATRALPPTPPAAISHIARR